MILDQQEPENTQSVLSTQTNQQFSDTKTNRQTQNTNTFNVDTRSINTINSPPPQQEINTDTEDQINQQLQTDNVQPFSTQTSSARSNITLHPQNQRFYADITISQPSKSLYPPILRPEVNTISQRSNILTNTYNKSIQETININTNSQQKNIPKNKSYIISTTSIVKHIC